MSVYPHKASNDGVYHYDFQIAGHRFHGSTGQTNRRDAETEEKRLKAEARAKVDGEKALLGPALTIEQACNRYWNEKQKDWGPASHKGVLTDLAWIVDHFGKNTMLHEIDDNLVAHMVATRRGDFIKKVMRKDGGSHAAREAQRRRGVKPVMITVVTDKRVSNTTVNRSTTNHLRRIMMRAHYTWKLHMQIIDWKQHLLSEPQERVREASVEEEKAILGNLPDGIREAVVFAILIGARRMEILNLEWTDIDWFGRRMTLRGKFGKSRVVPIPSDVYDLLWSQKDYHPTKVFTYVCRNTRFLPDGTHIVRGLRYALTKWNLRKTFDNAKAKAGVKNYRFHDNRHTAATRLLRDSKNLRLVQKLLGHVDIKTTTKYAHADIDDLANAMDALAAKRTEAKVEAIPTKRNIV